MNLKKWLSKNYINFRGWSTNRKIVVFESDDWGSIRMPSKEIYNYLLNKNLPVDNNPFTRYDCLESENDIEALYSILGKFCDCNGKKPILTTLNVMANPDFEKIAKSNFEYYHYEPFYESYKRYSQHKNVFKLLKDGINNQLIRPQFHGREHLNPIEWLKVLRSNEENEITAFKTSTLLGSGMCKATKRSEEYMAAFQYENKEEMLQIEFNTKEGLVMFEQIFGYKSTSFMPSCSIKGEHLDKVLNEFGVKYHQAGQYFQPIGQAMLKKVNKIWGETNSYGQFYWRRNVSFEPFAKRNFDWIGSCLQEMEIAFRWGKPAVINSHRVNFIGFIDEKNRSNTLFLLEELLRQMLKKWPDIEFLSSDQLGNLIEMDFE